MTRKNKLQKEVHQMKIRLKQRINSENGDYKRRRTLEEAIKRIQVKEDKIKQIDIEQTEVRNYAKKVCGYYGSNLPMFSHFYVLPKSKKAFFYRYGLERGMKAVYLSWVLGNKSERPFNPGSCRRKLIKQCNNNPVIKEEWEQFKRFMNESSN